MNRQPSHYESNTLPLDHQTISLCVLLLQTYSYVIFSNATVGYEVGRVNATDPDFGTYGEITYGSLGDASYFTVHPDTVNVKGQRTQKFNLLSAGLYSFIIIFFKLQKFKTQIGDEDGQTQS